MRGTQTWSLFPCIVLVCVTALEDGPAAVNIASGSEVQKSVPPTKTDASLAQLGPYPYKWEGSLTRHIRRCLIISGLAGDWPAETKEASLEAWSYDEQPLPSSCWPLVTKRNGLDAFDERQDQYFGSCATDWQKDIILLARLGYVDPSLLTFVSRTKGDLDKADELRECRERCYANLVCEFWFYSPPSGCFMQNHIGQVPYPLTKSMGVALAGSPGPGTELGENPTGEYILHYCKPTVAVVPIAAHGPSIEPDTKMELMEWKFVQGDRVPLGETAAVLRNVATKDLLKIESPANGVLTGIQVLPGEVIGADAVLARLEPLLPEKAVLIPAGEWRVDEVHVEPSDAVVAEQLIAILKDTHGKLLDLRAVTDGFIAQVLVKPGMTVSAGEKAVTMGVTTAPRKGALKALSVDGITAFSALSPTFSTSVKDYSITVPIDQPFYISAQTEKSDGYVGIESSDIPLQKGTPGCNKTAEKSKGTFGIPALDVKIYHLVVCTGFIQGNVMRDISTYTVTIGARGENPMLSDIQIPGLKLDPPFSPKKFDYKVVVPLGQKTVTIAPAQFENDNVQIEVLLPPGADGARRLQAGGGTVVTMPDNNHLEPGQSPVWDVPVVLKLTMDGKTSNYNLDLRENVSTYSYLEHIAVGLDPITGKSCTLSPKFSPSHLAYTCSFWYTDAQTAILQPTTSTALGKCRGCTVQAPPHVEKVHPLKVKVEELDKEDFKIGSEWSIVLTYGEVQIVEFDVTAEDRLTTSTYSIMLERSCPFYLNAQLSQYFSRGVTYTAWGVVALSHGGGGSQTIKAIDFMNGICSIQYTTALVKNFGGELGAVNDLMEDHVGDMFGSVVDMLPINVQGSFLDPTFWKKLKKQIRENIKKEFGGSKKRDDDTVGKLLETWFDYCSLRYSDGVETAKAEILSTPAGADLIKMQKEEGTIPKDPNEPIDCKVELEEVIDCKEFPVCPAEGQDDPKVFWTLIDDFEYWVKLSEDLQGGLLSFLMQVIIYGALLLGWWLLRVTVERWTVSQIGVSCMIAMASMALLCGIVWGLFGIMWAAALTMLGNVTVAFVTFSCCCCARRRKGSVGVPNHLQVLEPYRLWFFAMDIFIIANARKAALVLRLLPTFNVDVLRNNPLITALCHGLIMYLFLHVTGGFFITHALTSKKEETQRIPGFTYLRNLALNSDTEQGDPVRGYESSPAYHVKGTRAEEPLPRSKVMQYNDVAEEWQDTNIAHLTFTYVGRNVNYVIFLCTCFIPAPIGPIVRDGIRGICRGLWLTRRIARECVPIRPLPEKGDPEGKVQVFNPAVDDGDSEPFERDAKVDVYVFLSLRGWLPGRIVEVTEEAIRVEYGEHSEEKVLYAATLLSVLYPRDTLLKRSQAYQIGDPVEVYECGFPYGSWKRAVVTGIQEKGDVLVKRGDKDVETCVTYNKRPTWLRPAEEEAVQYKSPRQWLDYKMREQWADALTEYQARQGGFHLRDDNLVKVDPDRRGLKHVGSTRAITLIEPTLDPNVEKAELAIMVRSKALHSLEVGLAIDGKPLCGYQCRDGTRVGSMLEGKPAQSLNHEAHVAAEEGRSLYVQNSVIKFTFTNDGGAQHALAASDGNGSLLVEDNRGFSARLASSMPPRKKGDVVNFYVASEHAGDEVFLVAYHLVHHRSLEEERSDEVASARARVYLLQYLEDLTRQETFLRNFGIMWYEARNGLLLPREGNNETAIEDEEDLQAECKEFVPKLEGIKENISLADCALFAKRMAGISRLVPMVVLKAADKKKGPEADHGSATGAGASNKPRAQAKKGLSRAGTLHMAAAAAGGGGGVGGTAMGPTASLVQQSTTSAYGFKREVISPANGGSGNAAVVTSQVDEELCYFVDPPLASTHTSAKLQIKLETPSLSGMYVGITTEERVPIGAGASRGGTSSYLVRLSDTMRSEPDGEWTLLGDTSTLPRLRTGDEITLTYIVGDGHTRGGELRYEDSRGFQGKVTRSLPALSKDERMEFHFFVGTTHEGQGFRLMKIDAMEPSALWQKCLGWATEAIASEKAISGSPTHIMEMLIRSELRLNAFLRRKGLKYMFAEALTFRHGTSLRVDEDLIQGVPEDMDTGAQLRFKLRPYSKLLGHVSADWHKEDEIDEHAKPLNKWQWLCYEHWDKPWMQQQVPEQCDENGEQPDKKMDVPARNKVRQTVLGCFPSVCLKMGEGTVPLEVDAYEQAQMKEWMWQRLLHDCWIPKLQLGALVEYLRESFDHGGQDDAEGNLDASTEALGQVFFESHRFYCEVLKNKEVPHSSSWMDNNRFVNRVVSQLKEMVDWKELPFWKGSDAGRESQVVVELDYHRFRTEDKRRSDSFYQDVEARSRFAPGEIYDYTDIVSDYDGAGMGHLPPVGIKYFEFSMPDGSWISAGTKVELQHIPVLMRHVDGFRFCTPRKHLNTPWSDMFGVLFVGRSERDEYDWFIYTWCLLMCTVLVESLPMSGNALEAQLDREDRRLRELEEPQDPVPVQVVLIFLVVSFEAWVMCKRWVKGDSLLVAVPPVFQMIAVLGVMNPWREPPPAAMSSWVAIIFFLLSMFVSVMRTGDPEEAGEGTNDIYQDLERTRMEYKISETGGLFMFARGRQGEIALARKIRLRVSRLGLLMAGEVSAPTIGESSDKERKQKWPLKKLRYYEVPRGSRYKSVDKHPRLRPGSGDVSNSFPVNLDVDQLTGAKTTRQIFASIQYLSPLSQASSRFQTLMGADRVMPEHDPVLTLFLPDQESEREPVEMMENWQKQIEDWFEQELGVVREGTLADEVQEHLKRTLTEEALDPLTLRRFSIKVTTKIKAPPKVMREWENRYCYYTVLYDNEQIAVDFPEGRSSVLGHLVDDGESFPSVGFDSSRGSASRSSQKKVYGSSRTLDGYDSEHQEVVMDLPPFEVIPPASGRMRLALWAQVSEEVSLDAGEDELLGFTDLLDFNKLSQYSNAQKPLYCSWRLEGGGFSPLQVVPAVVDFQRAMVSYRQSWALNFSWHATLARESSYPMVFRRFFTSLHVHNQYDFQQINDELFVDPSEEQFWTLQHERWNAWFLLFILHLYGAIYFMWTTLLGVTTVLTALWCITIAMSLFMSHFSWFHVVRRNCCHGKASSVFWFLWHLPPLLPGVYTAGALIDLINAGNKTTAISFMAYLCIALILPMIANFCMARASSNAPQDLGGGFDLFRWLLPRRFRFKSSRVGQMNIVVREVSGRTDPDEWGYFNEQVSYLRDRLKDVALVEDAIRKPPFQGEQSDVFKMNALRVYGVSGDISYALAEFLRKHDLKNEAYGGPKFRETMQKVKDHLLQLDQTKYRIGPVERKCIGGQIVWQDAIKTRDIRQHIHRFVVDAKHVAMFVQTLVLFVAIVYQASLEDYYSQFEDSADVGLATSENCLFTAGVLVTVHLTTLPFLLLGWTYAGHPAVQNPRRSTVVWGILLINQAALLLLTIFTLIFIATGLSAFLGELLHMVMLASNCVWALLVCFRLAKLTWEVVLPLLPLRIKQRLFKHADKFRGTGIFAGYQFLPALKQDEVDECQLERELLARFRAHEAILRDQSKHVLHYVIVGEHLQPTAKALNMIGQPASGRYPDPIVPHAARLGARHCMISLDPRDFTVSWASHADTLVYVRRQLYWAFNGSYACAWAFLTRDMTVDKVSCETLLREKMSADHSGAKVIKDDPDFITVVVDCLSSGGRVSLASLGKLYEAAERGRMLEMPGFKELSQNSDVLDVLDPSNVDETAFLRRFTQWCTNHAKFSHLDELWAILSSRLSMEAKTFVHLMGEMPAFVQAVESRWSNLETDIVKDIQILTGRNDTSELTQPMLKPVCGSEYSDAALEDYVLPLGHVHAIKAGAHRIEGGPDDRLRSIEVTVSNEGRQSPEWKRFKAACSPEEQQRFFATITSTEGEVESVEIHMMQVPFTVWQRVIHDCCLDPYEVANDVQDAGAVGSPSGLPRDPTPEQCWLSLDTLRKQEPCCRFGDFLEPGMPCGRSLRAGDCVLARTDFGDYYSAEDLGIVQSIYRTKHFAERFNVIWVRTWKVSSMSMDRDQWRRQFKFLSGSLAMPSKPGPTLRVLRMKAAQSEQSSQTIEDTHGVTKTGQDDHKDSDEARLHAALVNEAIPLSRIFGGWERAAETIAERPGVKLESISENEVRMGTIIQVAKGLEVVVTSPDGDEDLSSHHHQAKALVFGVNTEGSDQATIEATWLLTGTGREGVVDFHEAWDSRFHIPVTEFSASYEVVRETENVVLMEGDYLEAYWHGDDEEHAPKDRGMIIDVIEDMFDVRWQRTGHTTAVSSFYWPVRYQLISQADPILTYTVEEPKGVKARHGCWRVTCGDFVRLHAEYPKVIQEGLHVFSVEPALPNGMKLNTKTGMILGSPADEVRRKSFVVTMRIEGTTRQCSATITFSSKHAIPPPPASLVMEISHAEDLKTRGTGFVRRSNTTRTSVSSASQFGASGRSGSMYSQGTQGTGGTGASPGVQHVASMRSVGSNSSVRPGRGLKISGEPVEPEFRFCIVEEEEKKTLLLAETREVAMDPVWCKRGLIGIPAPDIPWHFECWETDGTTGEKVLLGSADPCSTSDFLPAVDSEDHNREVRLTYEGFGVGRAFIKVGWARLLSIKVLQPLGIQQRRGLSVELRVESFKEVRKYRKSLGPEETPVFLNGEFPLLRSDKLTFRLLKENEISRNGAALTSTFLIAARDVEFFAKHSEGHPIDLVTDADDQGTALRLQVFNGTIQRDGISLLLDDTDED